MRALVNSITSSNVSAALMFSITVHMPSMSAVWRPLSDVGFAAVPANRFLDRLAHLANVLSVILNEATNAANVSPADTA